MNRLTARSERNFQSEHVADIPRYDHAMTERWANSTIFFVCDAGAAAAFYADMLGFTVNWRHDEAGRKWAAGISRDDCGLLLHSQQPDRVGKRA